MTIDASPGLTPEELNSLVDLAMLTPSPKIPALHLTRLMVLGYVQMTADGPLVTGDGLIRITADVVNKPRRHDLTLPTPLDSFRTK
jgi:hypothetical protein